MGFEPTRRLDAAYAIPIVIVPTTALAASPSDSNSVKGNSGNNKDFAGLVAIGGGRKVYMGRAPVNLFSGAEESAR